MAKKPKNFKSYKPSRQVVDVPTDIRIMELKSELKDLSNDYTHKLILDPEDNELEFLEEQIEKIENEIEDLLEEQ